MYIQIIDKLSRYYNFITYFWSALDSIAVIGGAFYLFFSLDKIIRDDVDILKF